MSKGSAFAITSEDLREFHQAHFNSSPSVNAIVRSNDPGRKLESNSDDAVERYPDGTVRTLTDEHITQFRMMEQMRRDTEKVEANLKNKLDSSDNPKIVSVEELAPGVPAHNSFLKAEYDKVFGIYANYQITLDTSNDDEYSKTCTKYGVKHYYPAVPINI